MRVDGGITDDLAGAGERASALEAAGYHGVFTAEAKHDPFLPLVRAADATQRVELSTGIAVAFARNPMTLANLGRDLHDHSGGRFILGLGSQIRPHVTKRFSMPWSAPADRMSELIRAIRAIWTAWNTGGELDFRGRFYTHTIMTPMFDPGPGPHGDPKIFLAGVGPRMTRMAGEVADGFMAHGFSTAEYFRTVTRPALEAGLTAAGRQRDRFEISMPVMAVIGPENEWAERGQSLRRQLAFYGSTPAYAPVLEHHGWGDLHPRLNAMSKRGEWVAMADLIDDDVLDAFAIHATIEDFPDRLAERYGGLLDRVQLHAGDQLGRAEWSEMVAAISRT